MNEYNAAMLDRFGLKEWGHSSKPTPAWVAGIPVPWEAEYRWRQDSRLSLSMWDHPRQWRRDSERFVTSEPYASADDAKTENNLRRVLLGLPGVAADTYRYGGLWFTGRTSLIVFRSTGSAPIAQNPTMTVEGESLPDGIAVNDYGQVVSLDPDGAWRERPEALMPWVKPRRLRLPEFILGVACPKHGAPSGTRCLARCPARAYAARSTMWDIPAVEGVFQ